METLCPMHLYFADMFMNFKDSLNDKIGSFIWRVLND